jgi:RimJ/RimL family protein N-acetyltransferase
MKIEGNHETIRTPVSDDLPYLQALWADPVTMKDVGGPIEIDDERARRWYAQMVDPGSESDRYFLVCAKDGTPVGEVSFHRYDPSTKTAELNIKIEAGKRYQGYGPEALRLLLGYFFGAFGGEAMLDPIALENRTGQRAISRFGFEHDPSRADVFLLRMTKQRYRAISIEHLSMDNNP